MRLPAKLLLLAGVVSAVAIAAYLLRAPGKPAASNPDQVTNELCIVAPATPYDAASGLDMLAPKSIPADARCPVCGMYPARFPRWAAQTVFKDGASHYFDSPVDLIAFLQQIERFNKRYTRKDIAVSHVTDFETGQWIEVDQAFFVQGSTALGPMRTADLPAFSTRQSADAFARKRNGKVLTFTQVTPELIQSMNRNVHHRH
ncbi:MAG: nitrous oxide reductase accessory protein NosL [Thiobacillus sp.]|jgi:nitrous oxide reductase accessory protein NosL|nr:nitrous oxide reductase accessory protein NosL [Thiobacillus sp.]